ncbi:hypothetical protein FHS72_000776 [Loktanella ponticola]|uniref:GmrSD restriction endonucleases N-terminal domain-containing protein n=1 Tax=Yoonia ponticola TaxID=1524255 RepID=A0A7W9BJD7_9RHOB|nr:DUF262 domain-containing protein [Yoonia ponticola]MBB5721169.1 hypothetical protein [Yoonia ponticola]
MSLKTEIEEARQSVKTDRLQLSVGEIISMYQNDELNIQPEFQRLFRWSDEKKANLIESILIDIPIPSIFTYENEDGTWELIDGLQRISTIFEFFGVLKELDTEDLLPPSALQKTTYLPSLENAVWENSDKIDGVPVDMQKALEKPQQLAIRRARLDVQVLKQPSDAETKFHLFQRLNRGGAYANEQEVRTCAMVMVAPDFVKRIKTLATNEKFVGMASIKETAVKRQKDVEYIVRTLVHTYRDYDNISDVEEFLDREIIEILTTENVDDFEEKFIFTVNILHEIFGSKALFPDAGTINSPGIRFSLRALEAVFVGIMRNTKDIQLLGHPEEFVKKQILGFWQQPEAEAMSASGLRGTQRLQRTIPFGDTWFKP